MSVTGDLGPRAFVEGYWQKEPLLVRGGFAPADAAVDGDTLAGLACEPEVDSRLVVTDARGEGWSCEDGPFDEARFAALPPSGWTLLVQAVDQWLPAMATLMARFDFLPRWRLDDVMVSFATEGGGVGPHFDHYDVFLLQVEGVRRWQVGQRCDAHSPLRDHPQMKLLADFHPRQDWCLAPGDLLYLPAGVAHWGTAASPSCITCSVGFRAPSRKEILQSAADALLEGFDDDGRYRDSPAAVDADVYRINDAALQAVRSFWGEDEQRLLEAALPDAFGRLVTEPRHPSLIEPALPRSARALAHRLERGGAVTFTHHPSSRFAWRAGRDPAGHGAVLYVDGEAFPASPAVARGICHGGIDATDLACEAAHALLDRLVAQGSLLLTR